MKNFVFIAIVSLLTSCASLRTSCEKDVKKSVITMINAIDTNQWGLALNQFDKNVYVDYQSLSGQPGAMVPAKGLVGNWQKLLDKVDTHHMLTNFEVTIEGDEAEVFSHVYASHQAKRVNYWDAYGRYHHKLRKTKDGWKITFMKLIMHGQKGNRKFLQQVSQ